MTVRSLFAHRAGRLAALAVAAWAGPTRAPAGEPDGAAQVRRAVAYLDARQDAWADFAGSGRGRGADRTACLSCHTGLGYALTRSTLRPFAAVAGVAAPEGRIVAAVARRVEHRAELDSPRFELMYHFDERKKVESRGTEAVLNALVLARADRAEGRAAPSPTTAAALRDLWAAQATAGDLAGSWDWLNFGLEPWEADGSRPFGAALAAIAVGSAPGYLDHPLDEAAAAGIRALRDYLRRRFPAENLYNRLWLLEAATAVPGLLSTDQRAEVVRQLLAARRDDGGWALARFGDFDRADGTPQPAESDGYATALAVHALRGAGLPPTRPEVAGGLAWLRSHQRADGSWPAHSLNKRRDPATFVGKFMADAATATAALVLAEAEHPGPIAPPALSPARPGE